MSITLIVPPPWFITGPPSSTPHLAGFLRANGIAARHVDLNIEFHDYILSKSFLSACRASINRFVAENARKEKIEPDMADKFAKCRGVARIIPHVLRHIDTAKRTLRAPHQNIAPADYAWANRVVGRCMEIASACYHPLDFTELLWKILPDGDYALNNIAAFAACDCPQPFSDFCDDRVKGTRFKDARLIGFSASTFTQLVVALLMARRLRRETNAHLTLGGYVTKLLYNEPASIKPLFRFFDSIIFFDGEHALMDLHRHVYDGMAIEKCRNTGYLKAKRVMINEPIFLEDIRKLPPPDFDGLPFRKYFSPKPVLSLAPSRGCFYRRCAFCGYNNDLDCSHITRIDDPKNFARKVVRLKRKHGTSWFVFSVSSIPPRVLREIMEELIRRKARVSWIMQNRIDGGFTEDMCALAAHSGCSRLEIGIESGSPKVLGLMSKGISLDHTERIIRALAKNGIYVWLNFIYGFPGETKADLSLTFDYIRRHKDILHGFVFGKYEPVRNSPLYNEPARYGVKLELKKKRGFQFFPVRKILYRNADHEKRMTTYMGMVKNFLAEMCLNDGFESLSALAVCRRDAPKDAVAQFLFPRSTLRNGLEASLFPASEGPWNSLTLKFDAKRFLYDPFRKTFMVGKKKRSISAARLYDLKTMRAYPCDAPTWRILNRFNGRDTVAEIFGGLAARQGARERLYHFIKALHGNGLLEMIPT